MHIIKNKAINLQHIFVTSLNGFVLTFMYFFAVVTMCVCVSIKELNTAY